MMIRSYEELIALGKDNVDALVKSGTLAGKGLEQLAREYLDSTARSADAAGAAVKELSGCTSPAQFVQVQARLAGEATESLFAEGRKLAEMSGAVMSASLEPLSARLETVLGAKV